MHCDWNTQGTVVINTYLGEGWSPSPDPLMVGIRSPDGLVPVVGSSTSNPGVLNSISKREEPGKTGAPCFKVPGSSRVPGPPPLSPSPHANRFVLGTAVINTHITSYVLHYVRVGRPPACVGYGAVSPGVCGVAPGGWGLVPGGNAAVSSGMSGLVSGGNSPGLERDVGPGRVTGTRRVPRAEKTGMVTYPGRRRRDLERWGICK